MKTIRLAFLGLLASMNASAACTKPELEALEEAGYSVTRALAWCARAAGNGGGAAAPHAAASPAPTIVAANATPAPTTRTDGAPPSPAPAGKSTTSPSTASTTTQSGSGSTPAVDKNVFAGAPPDALNGTIQPKVRIPGFQVADDASDNPRQFSLPANASFLITNDVIETPKGKTKAVERLYGRIKLDGFVKSGKVSKECNVNPTLFTDGCVLKYTLQDESPPLEIRDDVEYVVERANLANHENMRNGYTYGVLTAPYKFFPKDHSFSSSAVIGPYVGWQYTINDFSVKPIASFGLSSVAVTTTNAAGESTTSNRAALALSTGVLFDITNKFQLGFLVGADSAGPGSGYKYNGKPWLAIDIGYKFSN